MNTKEKLDHARRCKEYAINDAKAADKTIARLEAELEKPKLRHGSKLSLSGGCRIALYDSEGDLRGFDPNRNSFIDPAALYTVLDEPTIFDDLAALAEPLESFKVMEDGASQNNDFVEVKLLDDGRIRIRTSNYVYLEPDGSAEFGKMFNRVKATARKKQTVTD